MHGFRNCSARESTDSDVTSAGQLASAGHMASALVGAQRGESTELDGGAHRPAFGPGPEHERRLARGGA